jgi:hypothetical protein
MNLTDIETLTKKYADARERLGGVITELNDLIERAKRERLARIKELVAVAAERQANLHAAIEGSPELFDRPRTVVFHGIKVGYQKGKGVLEISDAQRTLAKIKELYDCPENYLHIIEKPNKDALAQLPAADLRKLGCTLTETGDQVVIRPVDSEVDKIVNALLKDAAEIEAAAKN